MRRRQFIHIVQGGAIATFMTAGIIGTTDRESPAYSQTTPKKQSAPKPKPSTQQGGTLNIEWLGHMSFLISGSDRRILTHPFKPAGCTAKFPRPNPSADLILTSSRLLDEGYTEGMPKDKLLTQPGAYNLAGLNFQGITMDHDRLGGRRFGMNVAWAWRQANLRIVHLGGAVSPVKGDQRILLGRPDVLIIPVGGGDKAYNATEAQAAITTLNPKLVIPTYYRTSKANDTCQIAAVDEFLALMPDVKVNKLSGSSLQVSASSLSDTMSIAVFQA